MKYQVDCQCRGGILLCFESSWYCNHYWRCFLWCRLLKRLNLWTLRTCKSLSHLAHLRFRNCYNSSWTYHWNYKDMNNLSQNIQVNGWCLFSIFKSKYDTNINGYYSTSHGLDLGQVFPLMGTFLSSFEEKQIKHFTVCLKVSA